MQPWTMGALELAAAIAAGRLSSVEALETFAGRIERFDGAINAVVVRDLDAARQRAREADAARTAGRSWGPLHGVPMTVKESFDLAGHPSTFGHPERAGHRAARDALAVARLKAAGAVVFGKTNVPKDLADWQSFNAVHGLTVNPWDHGRTPGGSSGGAAAALAAGLTGLELGSDIGGSIRIPAHYCGVYGHKPTFGIVPMRGHAMSDGAPSDISVAGPLARRAADLGLALDLIAGADPEAAGGWRLDLAEEPRPALRDFRIAILGDDAEFPVDAATRRAVADVAVSLRDAGATMVRDPKLPLPSREMWRLYITLLRGATSARMTVEAAARWRTVADGLDPAADDYAAVMARAFAQSHRDWLAANDERERLRRGWRAFFAGVDALIAPMTPTAAFAHVGDLPKEKQTLVIDGTVRPISDTYFWIGLASLSYLPATVVPAGESDEGLPIGVQIIGPEFADRRCLTLARLLEEAHRGFVPPPAYQ